jgi:GTP pyrophosphokinase
MMLMTKTDRPAEHGSAEGEFMQRLQMNFTVDEAASILNVYEYVAAKAGHMLSDVISIADLLLHQHADHYVIEAALLVPLRQKGIAGPEDIKKRFCGITASLVENVYFDELMRTDSEAHRKEDMRSFLSSVSRDSRSIILKLGLRLIQIERYIKNRDYQGGRSIARETMDIYVPLAGKMGTGIIRSRLEDACFHILEPETYDRLAKDVKPILAEDRECLNLMIKGVNSILSRNEIRGRVYGRTKGIYSIYRKMQRLEKPLRSIMDKIGIRIIVQSVKDCYAVLGILHAHFRHIAGTLDDYISIPKGNGYQSLHTCVYPIPHLTHKPVEIQIRTEAMHRQAEFGIAAHWLYKAGDEARPGGDMQMQWLRSLKTQRQHVSSHNEFVRLLYRQVFEDNLVIFGESGQQIRLPAGSTVRDYMDRVSQTGNVNRRARVNGEIRPMNFELHDGDTVEIVKEIGHDAVDLTDHHKL